MKGHWKGGVAIMLIAVLVSLAVLWLRSPRKAGEQSDGLADVVAYFDGRAPLAGTLRGDWGPRVDIPLSEIVSVTPLEEGTSAIVMINFREDCIYTKDASGRTWVNGVEVRQADEALPCKNGTNIRVKAGPDSVGKPFLISFTRQR